MFIENDEDFKRLVDVARLTHGEEFVWRMDVTDPAIAEKIQYDILPGSIIVNAAKTGLAIQRLPFVNQRERLNASAVFSSLLYAIWWLSLTNKLDAGLFGNRKLTDYLTYVGAGICPDNSPSGVLNMLRDAEYALFSSTIGSGGQYSSRTDYTAYACTVLALYGFIGGATLLKSQLAEAEIALQRRYPASHFHSYQQIFQESPVV